MKENKYDVVIIGAGIGGLVCGCYLAKNGVRVLVVERSAQPGGYCTSFKTKNFEFDAFVHSLGNIAEGGEFYNLVDYLNIRNDLNIIRFDPSDTIIAPDLRVSYWNDIERTIDSFSSVFKHERKQIRYFFTQILQVENLESVSLFRNKTFKDVLDSNFSDHQLKKLLSVVIFGNLGTPADQISAFTAIKHYKQFMVDGGYYLKDGIQSLPNILARRIKEFNGDIFYSSHVKKIIINNQIAKSVVLNDGEKVEASFIVSDCDARQTFLELVGREYLSEDLINKLNSFQPSMSLFVLYLGVRNDYKFDFNSGVNHWCLLDCGNSNDNINFDDGIDNSVRWFMIRPNHLKRTITIYTSAPYVGHEYWIKYKVQFENLLLKHAEQFMPKIKDNVLFKASVTPSSLNKWTLNYQGAGYGWASVRSQFMIPEFLRDSIVDNLFLCGHWATLGQGVPGVSITAERVARIILKRIRREV